MTVGPVLVRDPVIAEAELLSVANRCVDWAQSGCRARGIPMSILAGPTCKPQTTLAGSVRLGTHPATLFALSRPGTDTRC